MRNVAKSAISLVIASIFGLGLAACDRQQAGNESGPAEQAGRQIDQATVRAGKELNKAAEQAGQGLQQLGEKLQEDVHDLRKEGS